MSTNGSNSSDTNSKILDILQFTLFGIFGSVICITGLVGNILTLTVLSRPTMRRSNSSIYLIALTICDIVILIIFFIVFSIPLLTNQKYILPRFITDSLYPICLVAQTCAVYIIVGFTVERFIVIRYPLKNISITVNKSLKTVICIATGSIIYNIPRMLELVEIQTLGSGNKTHTKNLLKDHPLYKKIYYTCLYPWIMFILPFFVLLILNSWLLFTIKNSWKNKSKNQPTLGNFSANNKPNQRLINQSNKETNLNIMIVGIVFTFLICQFLPMIDNIIIHYGHPETMAYFTLYTVSSVFVVLNSAVNFLLYCFIGGKFRHVLLSIYCNKRISVNQTSTTNKLEINFSKDSPLRSCHENLLSQRYN